jgi:hypothetical protein
MIQTSHLINIHNLPTTLKRSINNHRCMQQMASIHPQKDIQPQIKMKMLLVYQKDSKADRLKFR